jgi:hypothetical protein
MGGEDMRSLPIRGAFVVQLHAETDMAQGHIIGRVEHVVSGQAARFQTLDELLAFLSRTLQAASPGEDDLSGAYPA